MPVPRRFDRQPPERDTTRINERIRVSEVRLIDEDGNQVGIKKTADALRYAQERDLDLVEVAPDAKPPVCRVLDYSKYKYEQAQKQKAARKHQQQITVREIKFRPKIAQHDYDTKKNHVERFLRHKDKVKITIMFRGREMAHPERGEMILNRLAEDLGEMAVVEQRPQQDGRNMTMLLSPGKAATAVRAATDGAPAGDGAPVGDAAPAADAAPVDDAASGPGRAGGNGAGRGGSKRSRARGDASAAAGDAEVPAGAAAAGDAAVPAGDAATGDAEVSEADTDGATGADAATGDGPPADADAPPREPRAEPEAPAS